MRGDRNVEVHGRSADAGSGRKEVREKRYEKEWMSQVWWHRVYRLVSLIVNLGNQRSYGSFDIGLVIRDTKVLRWLPIRGYRRGSTVEDHYLGSFSKVLIIYGNSIALRKRGYQKFVCLEKIEK